MEIEVRSSIDQTMQRLETDRQTLDFRQNQLKTQTKTY